MEEKKKEEEKDEKEDPRLEYIFNYLSKSMKIKQERWNKLLATEEYLVNIKNIKLIIYSVNVRNNKTCESYFANTCNFYVYNRFIYSCSTTISLTLRISYIRLT